MTTQFVDGDRIDIGFDGSKCIHARNCVLGQPDVFVPNAPGQWIHPDAASVEAIVAIAHSCPSGAISYRRHDGGPQEAPPRVNTARLRENGPVALHGQLEIAGEARTRATLCRCGASQNKPYCDGSHATSGFAGTGEPPLKDSPPLETRDGTLKATPLPNGPLMLAGSVEIVTGTGHTVERTTKAFLCRCGQSQNKPYCDGSHKAAGFVG